MVGWVGDDPSQLRPHLFADANFAGCELTQRSTSGLHLVIRGPRTCFPIAGQSKRQTCVSHSTPEAEIVAADFALRLVGLPALDLWHKILPHCPSLLFHEDNQAMIVVVKSGRNPTMRFIGRTHGVSVAWLHERCLAPGLQLVYELSARMAADIYTKGFVDPQLWENVRSLINVFDPAILRDKKRMQQLIDCSTTLRGGMMNWDLQKPLLLRACLASAVGLKTLRVAPSLSLRLPVSLGPLIKSTILKHGLFVPLLS